MFQKLPKHPLTLLNTQRCWCKSWRYKHHQSEWDTHISQSRKNEMELHLHNLLANRRCSHLSNHHRSLPLCYWACVYGCVCARERESEKEQINGQINNDRITCERFDFGLEHNLHSPWGLGARLWFASMVGRGCRAGRCWPAPNLIILASLNCATKESYHDDSPRF